MRHTRIRRRIKPLLIILLVVTIMLFIESRIEAIMPQVKYFTAARIEDAFGKRFDVSIGSIEGGILNPIVLKDCRIAGRGDYDFFKTLDIISIESEYRLWDILTKKDHRARSRHSPQAYLP